MRNCILQNDLGNPAFADAFENVVVVLRNTETSYRHEDLYPFDPGKMNCERLLELMKDCLNK